ncbi:MAG: N-acetylmuramoyl-L-alanine amidase [Bacteroidota bacterium]
MKKAIFIGIYLFLGLSLSASGNTPIVVFRSPFGKVNKGKENLPNGYRIKTVVIDAGHGGKDPGCHGKHSQEKHIALKLALKLGKAIERQFPSINVIYTRKTDIFIPLYQRAAIANKNNADLFISIHCNALSHKAQLVQGSETYVMGLHTAEHNLEVARRENESILLEEDYQKNYQGFDPNSDEGNIFLNLFQNAFLDQSIQFAEKVEAKIKGRAKRRSRGVKQAGFVVLKETTMPSVLIETGYLSNNSEENFLITDNGQNKIANAIFEAFVEYKLEVEDQSSEPLLALQSSLPTVKRQNGVVPSQRPANNPEKAVYFSKTPKAVPTRLALAEQPKQEPKTPTAGTAIVDDKAKAKASITFKVQLAASPNEIETSSQKWSKIPYIEVRKEKSLFKYLTGSHEAYEAAVQQRNEILAKGFNGAFVVAYKDGQRISLSEARK